MKKHPKKKNRNTISQYLLHADDSLNDKASANLCVDNANDALDFELEMRWLYSNTCGEKNAGACSVHLGFCCSVGDETQVEVWKSMTCGTFVV